MCRYVSNYILDIGPLWAPAILNSQEEWNFLKRKQKGFTDPRSYWIGGSTDFYRGKILDPSTYKTDNSGLKIIPKDLCNLYHMASAKD